MPEIVYRDVCMPVVCDISKARDEPTDRILATLNAAPSLAIVVTATAAAAAGVRQTPPTTKPPLQCYISDVI